MSEEVPAAVPPRRELSTGGASADGVDDDSTRIGAAGGPPDAPSGPALAIAGRNGAPDPAPPHSPDAARTRAPQGDTAHASPPNANTPGPETPSLERISETLPGGASAGSSAVQQVGRYQIKERLGRGGMATVYRAHDPGIGRDVAIKFLHATLCEDAEYRGRFLREARAAGGLSHPNIVTVYDVGEIQGRPYMAMELLVGEPLSSVMEAGQPLPIRDVLVMGIQLAGALDYAHAHGIVHRDIKPGNVVRLRNAQTIKVLDFGIAHMEASGAGEQRTRVGDVLGTPQYMSPEQTQGEKLDGRSDLFSVGILLYQMLSGQRPFQGNSAVALAMKIAKEEPPPLAKLRPELPTSFRRIVERCLAKPVERRFQTGHELAEALTRVLTELDAAAHAEGRPRIVPLRVKWAALMGLVVALVMGVSGTLITQRQQEAMMGQVTDNGASLVRFIAAQNALAALSEDWPMVDVAVQQIMKTGDFQSIVVVDREGTVRAAGDPALVGAPYQAPVGAQSLGAREGGVLLTRFKVDKERVLGFAAPITFQGRHVGSVSLGLTEQPLQRVARLSIGLMIALVAVTVAAVATAMYFLAAWFAQPIRMVSEAIGEIAKGRLDHRIGEKRNDEFGLLYAEYDRMAEALQRARWGGGPATVGKEPPPALRPDVAGSGSKDAAGAGLTVAAASADATGGGAPAPASLPGA